MRRLTSEAPRCCWCDQRCRDQADLIAHEAGHRHDIELQPSAKELAAGLEQAADDGLRAQAGVPRRAGSDA